MESGDFSLAAFTPYLEDIRKRLLRTAVLFAVTFVAGLFSTNLFVKFFVVFLKMKDVVIVATSPFQILELAMSVGFFCATIITIPFAMQQAYAFFSSGLLPKERRAILTLIPVSVFLFAIGFIYGFAVLYYAIEVIAEVNVSFGITNLWDISQFISQILLTSVLLGLIFEFPIILSLLIRIGVFPVSFLKKHRRIAIAAILIFVALLPPTDGLSFIVMSVPLVGIYELTIFFNSFHKRKELLKT